MYRRSVASLAAISLLMGIVDLDTGRLVGVVPARSAAAVSAWLDATPAR